MNRAELITDDFNRLSAPARKALVALVVERDSLKADIKKYLTTAMAAAVEIQEHWDAHCDSEGCGPANLIRRLENGFAESYGYTAKSLVEMTAERDSLETELAALRAQRVPMTDEQKAELYRADRKDIPVIVDNGVAFLPDWKVKEIIIAFEAFHGIAAKP